MANVKSKTKNAKIGQRGSLFYKMEEESTCCIFHEFVQNKQKKFISINWPFQKRERRERDQVAQPSTHISKQQLFKNGRHYFLLYGVLKESTINASSQNFLIFV